MLLTVEWWTSAADDVDGRAVARYCAAAVCCGHPRDHQCHVLHAVSSNLCSSLYQVSSVLCLATGLSPCLCPLLVGCLVNQATNAHLHDAVSVRVSAAAVNWQGSVTMYSSCYGNLTGNW